jgi:hypothetical protein
MLKIVCIHSARAIEMVHARLMPDFAAFIYRATAKKTTELVDESDRTPSESRTSESSDPAMETTCSKRSRDISDSC